MKRYHNPKEQNKRKRRVRDFKQGSWYPGETTEGRCHSKSPFDCGHPQCGICSKQRIDTKRERIEHKRTIKRNISEWEEN